MQISQFQDKILLVCSCKKGKVQEKELLQLGRTDYRSKINTLKRVQSRPYLRMIEWYLWLSISCIQETDQLKTQPVREGEETLLMKTNLLRHLLLSMMKCTVHMVTPRKITFWASSIRLVKLWFIIKTFFTQATEVNMTY